MASQTSSSSNDATANPNTPISHTPKPPTQKISRSRSQTQAPGSMPSKWRAVRTSKKRTRSHSPNLERRGSALRLLGSPELGSLRLANEENFQPLVSNSLISGASSHRKTLHRESPAVLQEIQPQLPPLPRPLSVRERLALDRISRSATAAVETSRSSLPPSSKEASHILTPAAIKQAAQAPPHSPPCSDPQKPPDPHIPQTEEKNVAPPSQPRPAQFLPQNSTPQEHQHQQRPQSSISNLKPETVPQNSPQKKGSPSIQKQADPSQAPKPVEKEIEVIDLLSSDDEAPAEPSPPKKKRQLLSRKTLSPTENRPLVKSNVSDSKSESGSEEDDPVADPDFTVQPRQTRSKSKYVAKSRVGRKRVSEEESSGFEGLLVLAETEEGQSSSQVGTLGKRKREKSKQTISSEKVGWSPKKGGQLKNGESSESRESRTPPKMSTILNEAASLNQRQRLETLARGSIPKEKILTVAQGEDVSMQEEALHTTLGVAGPSQSSSKPRHSLQSSTTIHSSSTAPVINSLEDEQINSTGSEALASKHNICNLDELRRHNSRLMDLEEEARLAKSIQSVLHNTSKTSKPESLISLNDMKVPTRGREGSNVHKPTQPKATRATISKISEGPETQQGPGTERARQLKRPKQGLVNEILARQKTPTPKMPARKGKGVQKSAPKKKRKAKQPLIEPKTSMGKRTVKDRYEESVTDDSIEDVNPSPTARSAALDSMGESSAKFKGFVDKWRHKKVDEYNFDAADVEFERESASIVAKVLKGIPKKNEKPKVIKKKNNVGKMTKVLTLAPSQLRDSTTPASFTSSSSSKRQQLENMPPTFLKPLPDIVQIELGSDIFSIHQEILSWHCPLLAEVCRVSGGRLPPDIADIEAEVFGIFVHWLNGQAYQLKGKDLLVNSLGKPAYQHRLVKLWVLAGRLRMPKLQNDAIDMLEERKNTIDDGRIQTQYFGWVYNNTTKGDCLRGYIIEACLKSSFSKNIYDAFPKELQQDIFEATLVKSEKRNDGEDGEAAASSMERHYVVEGSS
ncbi:uncharacterized protein PAC_18901 [Phialocephala subalpina]|uniref:BTB domain-containing protein n=1 Tax=Phialocephala subalpina TaxID=576137 RepID=A0A1L7XVI9_9HELO|nr:uncharacterized protein PAC_18901 [Phialocephala subalpina]